MGLKSKREDCRPLTILNLNSKLVESTIICDSVEKHLNETFSSHQGQLGVNKGVSTELLLLYLTEA